MNTSFSRSIMLLGIVAIIAWLNPATADDKVSREAPLRGIGGTRVTAYHAI